MNPPDFWYLWAFIRCFFNFGTVDDNSICWFSQRFWDMHDYPVHKGGTGVIDHFYVYTCHHCGEKFTI